MSSFGRSQRYGGTGALDRLSGNCVALTGLGGFVNGYPQGGARGLALPWAILFEAFSLSNPQFAMPECGITLSNAECGTPECGIRLENMVPKVTLTKRCIQGLLFAPPNGAWRSSRRLVAINMSLLTELFPSQRAIPLETAKKRPGRIAVAPVAVSGSRGGEAC